MSHDPRLTAFSLLMQGQDEATIRHCLRLRGACTVLAEALELDGTARRTLEDAALLHDIGMFRIAPALRAKAGELSEEEWREIRRHPDLGAELVEGITTLEDAAALVRGHHERWDGSGYPRGLAGEAIPLGARILAVIDAFDAMCKASHRRPGRTPEEAREEIRRCRGTQFDPRVVEAFERSFERLRDLRDAS